MMKKVLITAILTISFVFSAFAREYSYLNPPSISIMDFDVNMEELKDTDDNSKFTDKEYYGKLINQTLLTILIQKNSANDVLISGRNIPQVSANEKEFDNARYFPTLLKIYDKKYVETALGNNNYTVKDLYTNKSDAFSFQNLDFVVLGNVYETQNSIGLNVRVLNTFRGEELFSYIGFIDMNLSNLNSVCEDIAENIITDILKNYCSQFIIRVKDDADAEKMPSYFCQSSKEYDNEDQKISYNDTFKKDVFKDQYYWVLPGDYVFTVYSQTNRTVHEIPVTIDPREISVIEVNESHFLEEKGSVTISGISAKDAYSIELVEKVKDVKYLWEIGQVTGNERKRYSFTFNSGEFYSNFSNENDPQLTYNQFSKEITVENLSISQYDVKVTPVTESIKRKGITGIIYISSKEIETSSEVLADLEAEKNVVIGISEFNLEKDPVKNAYKTTRVTFLIKEAFSGEDINLYINNGDVSAYLLIRDIEKLVIEDEYTQEEWENLAGRSFHVEFERDNKYDSAYLTYEEILAGNDTVIVTDISNKEPASAERPRNGVTAKDSGGRSGFLSSFLK